MLQGNESALYGDKPKLTSAVTRERFFGATKGY